MNTVRSLKLRTDCLVSLFSIVKPYPMTSRKGKTCNEYPINSDGAFPFPDSSEETFYFKESFWLAIGKTSNRLAETDYNDTLSLRTNNFPSLYNIARL